jgi:hypothetical protein
MKKKILIFPLIGLLIFLWYNFPYLNYEYRKFQCSQTIKLFSLAISENKISDIDSYLEKNVVINFEWKKYSKKQLKNNLMKSYVIFKSMYIWGWFSKTPWWQTGVLAWTNLWELDYYVRFSQEGKISEISPHLNDKALRNCLSYILENNPQIHKKPRNS